MPRSAASSDSLFSARQDFYSLSGFFHRPCFCLQMLSLSAAVTPLLNAAPSLRPFTSLLVVRRLLKIVRVSPDPKHKTHVFRLNTGEA